MPICAICLKASAPPRAVSALVSPLVALRSALTLACAGSSPALILRPTPWAFALTSLSSSPTLMVISLAIFYLDEKVFSTVMSAAASVRQLSAERGRQAVDHLALPHRIDGGQELRPVQLAERPIAHRRALDALNQRVVKLDVRLQSCGDLHPHLPRPLYVRRRRRPELHSLGLGRLTQGMTHDVIRSVLFRPDLLPDRPDLRLDRDIITITFDLARTGVHCANRDRLMNGPHLRLFFVRQFAPVAGAAIAFH